MRNLYLVVDSYNTFVTALDVLPNNKLTLEYVKGKVLASSEESEQTALKTVQYPNKQNYIECIYRPKIKHMERACYFLRNEIHSDNKIQKALMKGYVSVFHETINKKTGLQTKVPQAI